VSLTWDEGDIVMIDGEPVVPVRAIRRQPTASAETVAGEAERLVTGERRDDYGDVRENFEVVAKLWSSIFGTEVTASQVAAAMVAWKMAREFTGAGKRDNFVDMIGYAILWATLEGHQ
jgi:hypothetical protein